MHFDTKQRAYLLVHTFCALRKACFKHHAHAGVDIDAINCATKYRTKMISKVSYSDQIKFNEAVLEPGTPVEQPTSSHKLLTSCYKIELKSNCKHVPADCAERAKQVGDTQMFNLLGR